MVMSAKQTGDPVQLKSGVWKISDQDGQRVMKVLRSQGEWQLNRMRQSGQLERAAFEAGIPMAIPVIPVLDGVGLWTPLGDERYVRLTEFVDGPHPDIDLKLARWVGSTLAQIEQLRLPAAVDESYPVHPLEEWAKWLGEARLMSLLPAVSDATRIIQSGLATEPVFQLAHRDVSTVNIIASPRGLVLIDFDHAGPEVPWWEFVHHVFNLDPSEAFVRPAFESYIQSGGTTGATDETAFAGYFRGMLEWIAYNVWLTLGHRDVPQSRRDEAHSIVHTGQISLPQELRSLDEWITLLR
ncbi:MAG TPA: hypothetical protein DGG94_22775 [Micromonosporaceae bacterium]|nr:hypothetical protein [Micromonosporaceae bacterium]HCU52580.1 hypothetical protein [Micromonosporaceae bacterium]